jgi:hypothetical protein
MGDKKNRTNTVKDGRQGSRADKVTPAHYIGNYK